MTRFTAFLAHQDVEPKPAASEDGAFRQLYPSLFTLGEIRHRRYARSSVAGMHDKHVMAEGGGAADQALAAFMACANLTSNRLLKMRLKGNAMAWTTPVLVEICIGLEINGYLPAEF